MSFTREDLESINGAIASGELTVVIDGQTITYRSIKELKEAKSHILAALRPKRGPFDGYRLHVDRGIR